ncbi:hypothetical protein LguiA_008390 [Lonicera macranthoides]
MESMNSVNLDSQHWEDELNREINVLKINDGKVLQKEQIGKRVDHYPMSPSVLHDSSFVGNVLQQRKHIQSVETQKPAATTTNVSHRRTQLFLHEKRCVHPRETMAMVVVTILEKRMRDDS